jgi:hypothetical protein
MCVCVCVCVCVCTCVPLVIQHGMRMGLIVMWPAPLYHISTLSQKRHDFRKKVTKHKMCVLISSTTYVRDISHSQKNWERYDQKCILVFRWSTSYSSAILMKYETSRQFSEKFRNIKCHKNPSSGSRVVPCGQTDQLDEANSRFSQSCNSVFLRFAHQTLLCTYPPHPFHYSCFDHPKDTWWWLFWIVCV